jgi:uncharacterized protein
MSKLTKVNQTAKTKPRKAKTSDGLVNVVSGLGTSKAKRSHNTFQFSLVNDFSQLDAAYQTNWLARQIVDAPAEDMTREWRTIKCDGADEIRAEEDRLQLHAAISEVVSWSRLFGGSAILMLTGQDLEKPLRVDKIKKGGLLRLVVLDRFDMSPLTLNNTNILAANYLQPEFYTIVNGKQRVHWSHFARFLGAKLPRRQRVQTMGWGDSELRKCLDDIMDIVASKDGIAELMQEANVDVITREGLADELANGEDDHIVQRYTLFSQMKSSINMALLDGDDSYDRKTLNLSGVAPVLETFMTWISGAADIPVTRLFGTSAKGLNATGEGDMSNYHSSLSSKRMYQVDPGLRVLDEVLVRSALGYWPDDFNYTWNPMQQPDLVEIANANKANADRDIAYLDAGVVTISQVQRRLQSEEAYQFDEERIEELEKIEAENMVDDLLDDHEAGRNPEPEPVPGAVPAAKPEKPVE